MGDACETNTNASLANLTVSTGTLYPAFAPGVYSYSVDLGIGQPEIAVTPTAAVPDGVALTLDGTTHGSGITGPLRGLDVNTTRAVEIVVEADGGTKSTYRVTIRRTLTQQAYIKSNNQSATNYNLGGNGIAGASAIAIDGDFMAVGRPNENGAIELFARVGAAWGALYAVYTGGNVNSDFGIAVKLSTDWLVVGAPAANANRGVVHAIRRSTLATNPEMHDAHTYFAIVGARSAVRHQYRSGR